MYGYLTVDRIKEWLRLISNQNILFYKVCSKWNYHFGQFGAEISNGQTLEKSAKVLASKSAETKMM